MSDDDESARDERRRPHCRVPSCWEIARRVTVDAARGRTVNVCRKHRKTFLQVTS